MAYVPGMFGENFLWWWINSYAKQLAPKDKEGSGRGPQVPENPEGGPPPVVPPKLNWEAARHISALKKWIDDKAADNEDLAGDLKLWEKRAAELGEPTPEATGKTTTSRHPLRRRPKLRGPTRCYPV